VDVGHNQERVSRGRAAGAPSRSCAWIPRLLFFVLLAMITPRVGALMGTAEKVAIRESRQPMPTIHFMAGSVATGLLLSFEDEVTETIHDTVCRQGKFCKYLCSIVQLIVTLARHGSRVRSIPNGSLGHQRNEILPLTLPNGLHLIELK